MNRLWKTRQKPVFFKVIFWFFKVYSDRTSRLTLKVLKSYFVDNFWFLDISGTPGRDSPVEILILITFYPKLKSVIWLETLQLKVLSKHVLKTSNGLYMPLIHPLINFGFICIVNLQLIKLLSNTARHYTKVCTCTMYDARSNKGLWYIDSLNFII